MSWFREFGTKFPYPDNYMTIDLETSGLSPETCYVCAIGHTVVRDRKPVETFETYLNWTTMPEVDQDTLKRQLQQVQEAMFKQGKPFHHTYERLAHDGQPPRDALNYYLDLIEKAELTNEPVIMHNGWRFDVEFLQAHWHNWLQISYLFGDNHVFDTGIMEKGSQMADDARTHVTPEDTLKTWSLRVGGIKAKGVKWALDAHCDEKYQLFARAGIDPEQSHRAGSDSQLLHLLFETQRSFGEPV